MSDIRKSLLGLSSELDRAIFDLAYLGQLYKDYHPGAAGDVSQVFSEETSYKLMNYFDKEASQWFLIKNIEALASIRKDGRTDYRSEGIDNALFYEHSLFMKNRVMLITRTGSQIPSISQTLVEEMSGKLLVLLQINKAGDSIRILFGNKQFGSIPSIETHIHILSGAISIQHGLENPALIHAHPQNLIMLGSHPKISGDAKRFNAVLYTQVEGINRISPDLVSLIPYKQSGSAKLVDASITPLSKHKIILWLNHGVTVRAPNIERGYAIMAYAERDAGVALEALKGNFVGLPMEVVKDFLHQNDLLDAYYALGLSN